MRLIPLLAPMRATVVVVAIASGNPAALLAQSTVEFTHERDVETSTVSPRRLTWSGNALLWVEADESRAPVLCVSDRDGRTERVSLEIPGAAGISVSGVAAGYDGALAAIGHAGTADPMSADFAIWISTDRTRRVVTPLTPYVPGVVTIAGDGAIWMLGGMRTDNPYRSETPPPLLKRLDPSGKVLSSSPVDGRARPDIAPDSVLLSHLVASANRVGWLTNGCQYIEYSNDGRELSRSDGPPGVANAQISGMALDPEDRVYVSKVGRPLEILTLNRSTGSWEPVTVTGGNGPHLTILLGFDGPTLITMERPGTMRRHTRDDYTVSRSRP